MPNVDCTPRDACVIVDVIAPSSACSLAQLHAGLDQLRAWGLEPRVPTDLFGAKGIVANDDVRRWQQLRNALTRPDSTLVWAVRGGYGSLRLLQRLDRLSRPARRKLLIGFSDITALQMLLVQSWSWPVLQGPMVSGLGSSELAESAKRAVRRAALGSAPEITFSGLRPLNARAHEAGVLRGKLVGGNLKTLQSLLGTKWGQLQRGSILFVEDRGERGYAIDRMLVQMQLAGYFRGLRALLFGSLTEGREPDGRFLGTEIIKRFAQTVSFPVFCGLPVGHDFATRSLPLGVRCEIETGRRAKLRIAPNWR